MTPTRDPNTSTSRWRLWPLGLAVAVLAACGGDGGGDTVATPGATSPGTGTSPGGTTPVRVKAFRAAGLVTAAPTLRTDASGGQTVSVAVLAQDGPRTLTTPAVAPARAAALQAALVPGNLVDWLPSATDANVVQVAADAAVTFNVILAKGNATATQFDLQKYGAAVGRNADAPGPMVAAGWVYAKTGATVTVGDGSMVTADQAGRAYPAPIKRYEETYTLAPDARVFNVNTASYGQSGASTLAALPVTADYRHATTARQAAYLVFDDNHENAATARVAAIWYFTPQATSDGKPVWDVPTLSTMLADKGTDPVSGLPYASINATSVTTAPYTRSTEPFEMVKGTMYYVGDNEVASYLLKADMGTADPADDKVIKIDAGWANSGYQYWRNLELVGRHLADARPWRPLRHRRRAIEDDGQRRQADQPVGVPRGRAGRQGRPAGQCLRHRGGAARHRDGDPGAHQQLLRL
jgi:hypothetical protein